MMIITKFKAISSLVGGNISGKEDGSRISYPEGVTPPSKAEIDAEVIRLQAEYDAQEYARNRAPLYPTIGDQLDLLWHAIDTGDWTAAKVKTTDFYTKLKKVKDDNPKPS